MRTIQQRPVLEYTFLKRRLRDWRLLKRIAQMFYQYMWVGRRIRRRYRELEARGEVFWVDEELNI
jgi:hypothetical protein